MEEEAILDLLQAATTVRISEAEVPLVLVLEALETAVDHLGLVGPRPDLETTAVAVSVLLFYWHILIVERPKGCFNCGQEGHRSAECSEPRKPRERREGKNC